MSTTLGILVFSLHLANPTNIPLNSFTPGIYVTTENGNTFGVYRNSVGKTSAYVGHSWDHFHVGLVSGYNKTVTPMVAFSYSFGGEFRGKLNFVPHKTAPLNLSVETTFIKP